MLAPHERGAVGELRLHVNNEHNILLAPMLRVTAEHEWLSRNLDDGGHAVAWLSAAGVAHKNNIGRCRRRKGGEVTHKSVVNIAANDKVLHCIADRFFP